MTPHVMHQSLPNPVAVPTTVYTYCGAAFNVKEHGRRFMWFADNASHPITCKRCIKAAPK